jgi:transcriptional regulator with XRE-family HTH domain
LRQWRKRRNLSQLELASRSAVSTRHLSFIETGRSRPSREMILHLAQRLELPLRERNRVLLAGGFAPAYPAHALEDAEMRLVRDALERFLAAHEPYPALVFDRHRTIVASNQAVGLLTRDVAAELLEPPANALRIALHPDGMAPRIRNLDEWASHLLSRLRRECEASFDPELDALHAELAAYYPESSRRAHEPASGALALFHTLQFDDADLTFISTVTRFGTALDVTLAELTIEAFYPADSATAAALARAARTAHRTRVS